MTDILAASTRVKLMVTSRQRLNLYAEQVWPLAGLELPEDVSDGHTPSAVQLFDERARRSEPGFQLQKKLSAVVEICRAVDGIPLALELAASWVHILPVETIAAEIRRNLDILASRHRDLPARHQSMRAVFDHSWKLLGEDERAVFRALSVFRGGFTAEAAWLVAGASLHTLASLVDKSLLKLNADGRYDLHELLRQYGEEDLEVSGVASSVHEAHCATYAAFVFERVENLKGPRQLEAISEFNADFENVHAAWMWAADHQQETLIEQMIDGVWIYCVRQHRQEVYSLCRYAEKKFAGKPGAAAERLWGRLLIRCANTVVLQKLESALEIARRSNDLAELAFCLYRGSHTVYDNREYDRAVELADQSLALYLQLGDQWSAAELFLIRAVADNGSDWNTIRFYGEESLRLRRAIGDRIGIGWSLAHSALHAGRTGDFAEAERLWLERSAIGRETGNQALVVSGLAAISHRVYFFQGQFEQARAAAEEVIRLGIRIDLPASIGWSLATLGLIACMDEEYEESIRLYQAAAAADTFRGIKMLTAWGMAMVECGRGDYRAARTHLSEASKYLITILGPVGIIGGLPILAICAARQGHPERAVERLALAFTHPVGASGWMQKWPLLSRLLAELEETLGSEAFLEAWERGRQLSLDAVTAELEAQRFGGDDSAPRQANRSRAEPLSDRELEVLALVADGLTNREIADRLFIGVSTVKKHIQHIYAKLDAKTRTGAVMRARDLHLIP
ncbi:MAG: hypothetical protein IPK19_27610 [Chloroflexi bacterium]|nr:hypothetical protein [Chloroflexota bacterium]